MKIILFLILSFPYSLFSISLSSIQEITSQTTTNVAGQLSRVVTNPAGQAASIWIKFFTNEIYTSFFNPSTNLWSTPQFLAFGIKSQLPEIGIDNSGNAIAIWVTSNLNSDVQTNDSNQIRVARYSVSTGQWTFQQLTIANTHITPRIAVNSVGNAIACWITGYPFVVEAVSYLASSNAWSGVVTLANGINAYPTLATTDNKGTITWQGFGSAQTITSAVVFP